MKERKADFEDERVWDRLEERSCITAWDGRVLAAALRKWRPMQGSRKAPNFLVTKHPTPLNHMLIAPWHKDQ